MLLATNGLWIWEGREKFLEKKSHFTLWSNKSYKVAKGNKT